MEIKNKTPHTINPDRCQACGDPAPATLCDYCETIRKHEKKESLAMTKPEPAKSACLWCNVPCDDVLCEACIAVADKQEQARKAAYID